MSAELHLFRFRIRELRIRTSIEAIVNKPLKTLDSVTFAIYRHHNGPAFAALQHRRILWIFAGQWHSRGSQRRSR
jgi:hypothetical protein